MRKITFMTFGRWPVTTAGDSKIFATAERERFFTPATAITIIRTGASLACCLLAIAKQDLVLLVAGLAIYWIGDILDGLVARWTDTETRIGAVVDILSDRLNAAAFYVGLVSMHSEMATPVAVYLFEFMVIDCFLSLSFLAWPLKSPNYFYAIDQRIWRWSWSIPGKVANSAFFALLLLVTGWWHVGLAIALSLLALKTYSLAILLRIGMPIPATRMPIA
jgi:CDP-diacylglycerol---glycerol-3-phosphate 3-phosphatidyltransferase